MTISGNILLVNLSFLGDSVLATPLIRNIKKIHPNSNLSVLTTRDAFSLFEGNPDISDVLIFDKRGADSGFGIFKKAKEIQAKKFDIAYSLHRHPRIALLLWLAKIPVRIGFKNSKLSFLYTKKIERLKGDHEVKRNLSLLREEMELTELDDNLVLPEITLTDKFELVSKNFIVIVPGSAWATKRWDALQLKAFTQKIIREKISKEINNEDKLFKIVILGAPNETEYNSKIFNGLDVVDLTGKSTIKESLSIIKHAKALIANDSFALHVASAYKVPVIAIFCSTIPEFGFSPWKTLSFIHERKNLWCRPCGRHGKKDCPTGTWECTTGVRAEEVYESYRKI